MIETTLFVTVLVIAGLAPFVLYFLVRAERGHRDEMDRRAAERAARRDTPDEE